MFRYPLLLLPLVFAHGAIGLGYVAMLVQLLLHIPQNDRFTDLSVLFLRLYHVCRVLRVYGTTQERTRKQEHGVCLGDVSLPVDLLQPVNFVQVLPV